MRITASSEREKERITDFDQYITDSIHQNHHALREILGLVSSTPNTMWISEYIEI